MYVQHEDRRHYLKESLRNYVLLKKNIYLNRPKKQPTEDDILKCECMPSTSAVR